MYDLCQFVSEFCREGDINREQMGNIMGLVLPWHRRHAMMLASQLPDNTADARLIMAAMTELLEHFMGDQLQPVPAIIPAINGARGGF